MIKNTKRLSYLFVVICIKQLVCYEKVIPLF